MKRVYLIRHGEAEFLGRNGRGDHGRALTEEGQQQARNLGGLLSDAGIAVVLASSAERAAQTASAMGLPAEVRLLDELYNAGSPGLLQALSTLEDEVDAVALVAHAPGVPTLVDELAGADADPHAAASVLHHFPTATVAGIEVPGTWAELGTCATRLFWAARG